VGDRLGRFGLTSASRTAKAATVPLCAVCAGYPLVISPLVAAGVIGSGAFLHVLIPLLMPLNLWLLRLSYREHRRPWGLALAAASIPFILAHMAGHFVFGGDERVLLALIWAGGGLLVAGIMVDWRDQRGAAHLGSCATPAAYWEAVLTGRHPGLRRGRRVLRLLPSSPRCKLCNAPFAPPFGPVSRLLGKGPSAKNPTFCGDCLTKTPLGGAEVEMSLLFADVRGSTSLSQRLGPSEYTKLMNRFYAAGTDALIRTDALIDQFVGDEVIGLYVPGFAGEGHARRAIEGAEELLRATGHADPEGPWLGVGAGVHTGIAVVGTVGVEGLVTDVRAVGEALNATARLASAAGPGEILISEAACRAAGLDVNGLEQRHLELKGLSMPVDVRVLRVAPDRPVALASSP
jgi:adenylate cyclase